MQNYFQILYIFTDIFNFYTLSKDLSGFKSTKLVDFQHCFVGFCICDYRNSRHLSQKMPKIYFDISNQRKRFSLMPKKILFPHQGFAREEKKICSLSDPHFLGKKVHSHSRYKLSLICTFDKCNGRDPLTLILHSAS